jgi:hypothetical protein
MGVLDQWSMYATFCHQKASVSVHFPTSKLLISTGKRQIVGISKTCVIIRTFLQPVLEINRPDGQTGLVIGPDLG